MASSRIIPIRDDRRGATDATNAPGAPSPLDAKNAAWSPGEVLRDARGRALRDLRISVTDRCNFRCTYCMPREAFGADHEFLPQRELLSFEEIARLAAIFVEFGVRKIRITGGEPLLRRRLDRLIALLVPLGVDLTLTTNGSLLARQAAGLRAAGLARVTVSLDALDDRIFRAMNDADYSVSSVLEAIDEAARVGLAPVKINAVVKGGVNDGQVLPMARHFRGSGHVLRFIEYMDVGSTNGWRMDEVVPSAEVIRRINAEFPLEPVTAAHPGEVAERWRYKDGAGEIGVISSVTRAFCGDCNRLRISTDGRLYTCLFAERGEDLKALLRSGASDEGLRNFVVSLWRRREDRYSEIRSAATPGLGNASRRIEMSYIGG